MSRGPGKVERAILDGLSQRDQRSPAPSTLDLACHVYNVTGEAELTPAQIGAVQRALRGLRERGEVVEHVPPRASSWRLPPARPHNTRPKPQQKQGVSHDDRT
jgi:hypothetical protein